MSSPVASENNATTSSAMLRRTVAVVDMVGYSSIAKILEENISAASVADLNHQIQAFMTAALAQLPDPHPFCVIARTGDGIILLFEAVDDAHLFAHHVHLIAIQHNESRAEGTAKRRFRVGIATGDVSATACSSSPAEYAGITIANAVRLEAAAHVGEIVMDASSFAALSPDLQHLYGPETSVRGKREEIFRVHRFQVVEPSRLHAPALPPYITRRSLLAAAALVTAGTALTAYVEAPKARDWIWARSHPLPPKRFVALMGWLTPNDTAIAPTIGTVLTAIENELSRAEAFDRNLLILPYSSSGNTTSIGELNRIRDSLGANLVLVASGVMSLGELHISLRILDSASSHNLREATLHVPSSQQVTLPKRAVQAAAHLLEISGFVDEQKRLPQGTSSAQAFSFFQNAEQFRIEDNDANLEKAIDLYKRAVDADPRYAEAYARLGVAYCRLSVIRHDSAALSLARENAQTAVVLDPASASAHMALAGVHDETGDVKSALDEMNKALAVDPVNPQTLIWQADIYTRLNRWQDAETAFTRIIKARPNNWLAHNQFGIVYNAEGKYLPALHEFQAASIVFPKSTFALTNIGAVLLQLGELALAKVSCQKSLDVRLTALATVNMAAISRSESDLNRAIAFAKQATDLAPDWSSAWLELGDCCSLVPGKKDQALQAYQTGRHAQDAQIAINPNDGPGLMLLALFQVKCNPAANVNPLVDRAEASPAGDMDSQLAKARILELTSQRSKALATLQACFSRGATRFQIESMLDLKDLISDPAYNSINV